MHGRGWLPNELQDNNTHYMGKTTMINRTLDRAWE